MRRYLEVKGFVEIHFLLKVEFKADRAHKGAVESHHKIIYSQSRVESSPTFTSVSFAKSEEKSLTLDFVRTLVIGGIRMLILSSKRSVPFGHLKASRRCSKSGDIWKLTKQSMVFVGFLSLTLSALIHFTWRLAGWLVGSLYVADLRGQMHAISRFVDRSNSRDKDLERHSTQEMNRMGQRQSCSRLNPIMIFFWYQALPVSENLIWEAYQYLCCSLAPITNLRMSLI